MKKSLLCSLGLLLLVAGPAAAQELPDTDVRYSGIRLDGARLEAGLVSPQNTSSTFVSGFTVSLGTLLWPALDFSAGLRYWSADIDRSAFGSSARGEISDLGTHANVYLHLFGAKGVRPYILTGVAGHFVGADVPDDRSLEDALNGMRFGADIGLGLATTRPGVGVRAEFRREFVEDAGNWNLVVGVGWWPRTRARSRPAQEVDPRFTMSPVTVAQPTVIPTANDELNRTLKELADNNKAMRAEIDSMRAQISKPALPQTPPVEVAEVKEPTPSRTDQLRKALRRLAAMSGNPDAFRETEDGFVFSLNRSVLFASGSAELQVGALEELRRLAVLLIRFPEVSLLVEGHTDSAGNPTVNERLSQERSEAVMFELVRLNVDASRIRAVGYGSSRAIADNSTADGRSLNRRVEIRLINVGLDSDS